MNTHVEDFSTWDTGALVTVPPESLEYSDLVGLVIELQGRLLEHDWMRRQLEK